MKSTRDARMNAPKFPCLMLGSNALIVLFKQRGVGTVVFEAEPYYGLGHHSDTWDMHHFEPFSGVVKLDSAD